jgi:hypothetical protein
MRRKITFTLLVLVTVIMASCQFPRIPERSVVVDRYIIAEKRGVTYYPHFNTVMPYRRPAQYILVLSDSTGNVYHFHAAEEQFYLVHVGDSAYYNREHKVISFK